MSFSPRRKNFKIKILHSKYLNSKNSSKKKKTFSKNLMKDYLVRYNKKYWINQFSTNQKNIKKKFANYLTERDNNLNYYTLEKENELNNSLKSGVYELDKWVLKKLKKYISQQNFSLEKKNSDIFKSELVVINNFIKDKDKDKNIQITPNSKRHGLLGLRNSVKKKIAVTNETLQAESNQKILLNLIKNKLIKHSYYKKNPNKLQMIAKIITSDYIASFKILNFYNHQNLFKIKDLLEEIKNDLKKDISKIIEKKDNQINLLEYEKVLKKNLKTNLNQILRGKELLSNHENNISDKKKKIYIEKEKFFKLIELWKESVKKNKDEKFDVKNYLKMNEFNSRKKRLEKKFNLMMRNSTKYIENETKKKEKIKNKIIDLKFSKKWLNFKLKEFYIDFLRNPEYLLKSDKSIIYMIKKIISLKEQINISYFSNFYDKKDIEFILKYVDYLKNYEDFKKKNDTYIDSSKNNLKKKYNELLYNDKTSEKINKLKTVLKNFKSTQCKAFQREKVIIGRKYFFDKYSCVSAKILPTTFPECFKNIPINDFNLGKTFTLKKKNIHTLKKNYINNVITRFVKINTNKILNLENSKKLKILLSVIFGKKEMKIILKNLLTNEKIQIIPID